MGELDDNKELQTEDNSIETTNPTVVDSNAIPTKISFKKGNPIVEVYDTEDKQAKELVVENKSVVSIDTNAQKERIKRSIQKNYGDRKKSFVAAMIVFSLALVAMVLMLVFNAQIVELIEEMSGDKIKSANDGLALLIFYIFVFPILIVIFIIMFAPVYGLSIASVCLFAGTVKSTKKAYKVTSIILLIVSSIILLALTVFCIACIAQLVN